jgi:hypothetical protein
MFNKFSKFFEFSHFGHPNTKEEVVFTMVYTAKKIDPIFLLLDADLLQAFVNVVMHFLEY